MNHLEGRGAALGVVILALGLRLGHLLDFARLPLFTRPTVDAALYLETATAFATTGSLPAVFFKPPLFPILLGAWLRLVDVDFFLLRLPFVVLGAATAGLTWWVARRVFGPAVALLAGIFQATNRSAVYFDGELLEIGLATFLQLLGLAAVLVASGRSGRRSAWIAGLILGLGCVARPTFFLWAGFAVAHLGRRRWLPALLGLVVAVLPVSLHNRIRGGDAVLVSANLGINLYIGNSPWANGRIAPTPEFPAQPARARRLATAIAEEASGRPLRPSEVSRYWSRRALQSAADRPGETLALWGKKLYFAWHGAPISDNEDLQGLGRYLWVLRFLPGMWLLAPLGLVGLCMARSTHRRGLLLLRTFLGLQIVSLLPFFVVERFRLPWAPVLAMFAAWTLVEVGRCWAAQRRRSLGVALASLGAAVLCNVPLWGVTDAPAFNLDYKIAYAYQQQGRTQAAMAAYRRAIAQEPGAALPRNALGVLMAQRGENLDEAARWIESALALDPTFQAHFAESLAFVELRRGNPEAALRACQRGLDAAPERPLQAKLLLRRGEALAALGRAAQAAAALRQAAHLGGPGETGQRARRLLQELEAPRQTEQPGS